MKKIKFNYKNIEFNLYEVLILILPFSLILGNVAININIFLVILFFFHFIYLNKIEIIHFFRNNIFIFCIIFAVINISLSVNILFSLKAFLGVLKYYLLFIILTFFFKKEKNLKFLSLIFFVTLNFLIIDTFIQYIYGKDIFGYKSILEISEDQTRTRLSGPFGDELVVGGFIKNIFIISLSYFIIKKNFLFYIYLFIAITIVFLSGERSPSFMFFLLMTIIFIFFEDSFKKKITLFLVMTLSVIFIFYLDPDLKKSSFDRTFKQFGIIHSNISYKNHKNFFDSQWGAHYLTAYEIFKENKYIGSGAKAFRFTCKDEKYKDINSVRANARCATHPHNIYVEILSETGIVGLFIFLYLIIRTLFLQISLVLKKNQRNYNFHLSSLCIFAVLFWPLQTTGSFFSTFNGFFYWFYAAIIYSNQKFKPYKI